MPSRASWRRWIDQAVRYILPLDGEGGSTRSVETEGVETLAIDQVGNGAATPSVPGQAGDTSPIKGEDVPPLSATEKDIYNAGPARLGVGNRLHPSP